MAYHGDFEVRIGRWFGRSYGDGLLAASWPTPGDPVDRPTLTVRTDSPLHRALIRAKDRTLLRFQVKPLARRHYPPDIASRWIQRRNVEVRTIMGPRP